MGCNNDQTVVLLYQCVAVSVESVLPGLLGQTKEIKTSTVEANLLLYDRQQRHFPIFGITFCFRDALQIVHHVGSACRLEVAKSFLEGQNIFDIKENEGLDFLVVLLNRWTDSILIGTHFGKYKNVALKFVGIWAVVICVARAGPIGSDKREDGTAGDRSKCFESDGGITRLFH